MRFPLYVFDAYGTLFDVHSAVARHRARIGGQADRLSEIWRTKQLEYSWTRSLMGAHRDFRQLTEEALHYAIACTAPLAPDLRADLLDAYERLDAYPDALPALAAIRASGARTAILSNGSPDMLQSAVDASGLGAHLDAVLSIEEAGVFKTHPRAYELVRQRFGLQPRSVSFQSSNRWDIAGAARFGFHAVWINRTNQPDEYRDLPPARMVASLSGLD